MKKYTFALVFLALCPISLLAQTKNFPVSKQETVRKNALKTPQTASQTLGITVEKYSKNFEVNADGTAVETWEMQQRFDSDLVIERFKKFERAFNADLQKAEILDAYILKADGERRALRTDAARIIPTPQAEAAPTFSSLNQIQILYDNLEAGDATYFKIRLTTLVPSFERQFDFLEVFPLGFAWKSIEVNVAAPRDFPLYVQAVDLDGGRMPDENGRARWSWRKSNLKAFDIEPGMYDFFNSSPRVAATSFKNFDELGAAYWKEAQKKAVVTEEVQRLANDITKDINDPQQKAYAIYEWVNKNIRYLSIVMDKGGWIPHSTTEILANGYGDCKDYATIIYALLKAKGIESHPVLIRSELGSWFPEVAAPDYFNHAILYIPSLDLFADATAPNTRLGLLTQQNVGKKAILAGERTGVIEMPRDKPADNRLLSDVEIDFAPDGSLKAFSKNVYDGRTEIVFRPIFADSALQKNSENYVQMLLSYFGVEGAGKLVKIGNPFKVGEPLTVEMEVEMRNYATFQARGALRMPLAVNMLNANELEQFVKTERRSTNLILGATHFRENFRLNFPEGFKVETLPPAVNFSNSVGSYRAEFILENGAVRATRELIINRDIISTRDYPQIRELIKKSVAGANAEIRYSASPSLARRKNAHFVNKSKVFSGSTLKNSDEQLLNAEQAAAAETRLQTAPDDIETRKRLLRFYADYDAEETTSRRARMLKHRLWLLEKNPEIDDEEIYGSESPQYLPGEKDYSALRDAWLRQIEINKTNARIRLNAVGFFRFKEPSIAIKLLEEGRRIERENFDFPILLNELLYNKADASGENSLERLKLLSRAFENGEAALALLKKERSADRDARRADLLQTHSKIAFELEQFDRAKQLATELILDFGQDAENRNYAAATHAGNIILGRVAVRENQPAKAKQYLLIAIRAPLRREKSYFSKLDMQLARELLEMGEKDTVAEYLKLCEKMLDFSNLFAGKVQALKTWQEQINQGKMPSFDFTRM